MSDYSVELRGVTKAFDGHLAVDDVSFAIRSGTAFGLLGPNGAGKTTTIRMMMNIIMPDSGEVRILGQSSMEEMKRRIGYLPEERGLYKRMKVIDQLTFLGEIRGLRASLARTTAMGWLERLEIADWAPKKVEDLSKGMQQKIQFIGCVIHDPDIIILDEPFSGLDPVNTRVLKDLFIEFREMGKTLIFSTHIMEQAEQLCDEIVLINRARVVLNGTMGEITRRYSGNKIMLRGSGETARLEKVDGVHSVEVKEDGVLIELAPETNRSDFLREATQVWNIESAVPHEATLDEIFIQVVGASVDAVERESSAGAK